MRVLRLESFFNGNRVNYAVGVSLTEEVRPSTSLHWNDGETAGLRDKMGTIMYADAYANEKHSLGEGYTIKLHVGDIL